MASSARIDELRKKFDENPRRYFAPLANEYRKAGDLEQAIFICQEYLPQQPGHMSGHIVYGQALFEMGRHDEAKAVFETALSLDPENLIALKHLGDIARQAGDNDAARVWYQRVLEADPRNEEIAQLMLSLLGGEQPAAQSQATPASASSAAPQPATGAAPTPIATPAVPPKAYEEAEEAPRPSHAEAAASAFDVEKSEEGTQLAAAPVPPPLPEVPPPLPASPSSRAATTESRADELLDLEDFSFGGTSAASKSPAAEAAPPPAPAPSPDEATGEEGFNLGEEEGPFEADPFAIAATPAVAKPAVPPSPPIELATDVNLGLPAEEEPAPAPADTGSLAGLESFEAGGSVAGSDSGETVEFAPIDGGHGGTELSSSYGGALGETVVEPFAEATAAGAPAEAAPEAPAEAFVTETMAELYLQQGHLESALEIYRKLIEQRPTDEQLRARVRAVEERAYGAAPTEAEVSPPATDAGPTIRDFLSGLVGRHASPAPPTPTSPAAVEPEISNADETGDAAAVSFEMTPLAEEGAGAEGVESAIAGIEVPAPEAEARPTPISSSETVSGSIDALFSGADAATTETRDTGAASTLAEAFAPEGPETTPLQGVPAHQASNELSLDHVFKANTPPRSTPESESAGSDFSFDQFFSEEAGEGAPPSGGAEGPSGGAQQATDDIAQFNAWLNGLKKT